MSIHYMYVMYYTVAPTMLTMTIKPETVYEGDTVDISCTSEGGVPAAQFEYGQYGIIG